MIESENNQKIIEKLSELEDKIAALESKSEQMGREVSSIRAGLEDIKAMEGQLPEISMQVPREIPTQHRRKTGSNRVPVAAKPARERQSLEQFIGKNAMGIGASVLVFIAMVMFATLLLPYLGEEVKCAAMYLFSFALIGLGEWIYRKGKNSYLILSACGVGALYISVVATNIYFHFINNIPMYILLVLWAGCISYLGKKRNLLFVIVAQIGISMAVIMSAYGIDTPRYLYLRFAFVLITEALYFFIFMKDEYKYNLTDTIGLLAAFFVFDYVVHYKHLNFNYAANKPGYAIVLITIIIMAAAVCRLIVISPERKSAEVSVITAFAGAVCVLAVCRLLERSAQVLGYLSLPFENNTLLSDSAWCYAPLSMYLGAALLAAVYKHRKKKVDLSRLLYVGFILLICSLMLWPHNVTPTALAIVIAALVIINRKFRRRDIYIVSAAIALLGAMTVLREEQLYPGLAIFALLMAQAALYYRDIKRSGGYIAYERLAYITAALFIPVLTSVAAGKYIPISSYLTCLIILALFIALQLAVRALKLADCCGGRLGLFHIANLAMMVFALFGFVYVNTGAQVLTYGLLAIGLFAINTLDLLEIKEGFGAYIAGKYTVLTAFIINEFHASGYVYSIAFLLIATACVAAGFKIGNKSVRLYGLVLSMLSVFKLIMFDISYTNTLGRAMSFLVSGLICFGISLIYNRIKKVSGEVSGDGSF